MLCDGAGRNRYNMGRDVDLRDEEFRAGSSVELQAGSLRQDEKNVFRFVGHDKRRADGLQLYPGFALRMVDQG